LDGAAAALEGAVQPFSDSLHDVVRHQLGSLAAARRLGSPIEGVNVSKITPMQVLTCFMLVLLIFYSTRLIIHIAGVNLRFDRQLTTLIDQKKQHKRTQQARAVAAAKEPDSAIEEDKPQSASEKTPMQRYEEMLDVAIESARNNQMRFPIKLFGMAITYTVLLGWLLLAIQPLLKEVKTMSPILVKGACSWVENSPFVEGLQENLDSVEGKLDNTVDTVIDNGLGVKRLRRLKEETEKETKTTAEKKKAIPKASVKSLIENSVCKPILELLGAKSKEVEKKVDAAIKDADAQQKEADAGHRRLGELPALSDAVDSWWEEHPGDPDMKLVLVKLALRQLRKEAHRLLVTAPAAIRDMYLAHGLEPALDLGSTYQNSQVQSPFGTLLAHHVEL